MPTRRQFIAATGLAALAGPFAGFRAGADKGNRLVPPRLRVGDRVGLVSPAGATHTEADLVEMEANVRSIGLIPVRGAHVLDVFGYFGGADEARAADVNAFFADDTIRAVWPLRGGWGCARMLPHLDFALIRQHPKVLVGFSDITALLSAFYAQAHLVSYHGPVASSSFGDFSLTHLRGTLFDALPMTMAPVDRAPDVITPGVAQGRLFGGNLTVLAALVGTPYVPTTLEGHVLFLEDVGEEPYRIDRMLTQLRLAGLFNGLRGVVFGDCRNCTPEPGYERLGFSLADVLRQHVAPLGIPAFYGTMIGHITDKFTVPVGIDAEIDASRGTLRLLEPAVA